MNIIERNLLVGRRQKLSQSEQVVEELCAYHGTIVESQLEEILSAIVEKFACEVLVRFDHQVSERLAGDIENETQTELVE